MQQPFVTIKDKHWVVSDFKDPKGMLNRTEYGFPATKAGERKLGEFFKKNKINSVSCSSSVDFPVDGGLSKNYCAREVLQRALYHPDAEAAAIEVLRRPELKTLLQRVACKTKGKEDRAVRLLLARMDSI